MTTETESQNSTTFNPHLTDPQILDSVKFSEKDTLVLDNIVSHLDEGDKLLVKKACFYAYLCHGEQKRLSGDPYIEHLFQVTGILSQYKLDAPTLATAFMHDLIEEKTGATIEDVKNLFGDEIAGLVDDVTKLTGLFSRQEREVSRQTSNINPEQAIENLRKIFLAMARDLRVILVKLADRLHNLRTLEYTSPQVQLSIARETLDIFAPIASRLGIWEFKAELEDLSFRYAYPEDYADLTRQLEAKRPSFEDDLKQVVDTLRIKLSEFGIEAELEYRSKHFYSIYKKAKRTGKGLDEIYDLVAVRVIVDTIEDCYSVFGIVHSLWTPINNRIKDYISRPKPNNYRSLHTTVIGPREQPLEIQIRTHEMHQINEVGIAAHWAYKEGKKAPKGSSLFSDLYSWIRALLDWNSDIHEGGEYAEHLKVNLLAQEVFVFTPKGEVVDLPLGSTPLDFAYRIHTEVGHRCVGALVNKKMVTLTYKLQNADVVEIQTSKQGTPSRDWLRTCASHQAISKIRAWFKKERRSENIANGKDSLKRELVKHRLEASLTDDAIMQKVAELLNYSTVDDLLASIGYGETTLPQVINRLLNLKAKEQPELEAQSGKVAKVHRKSSGGKDVIVQNMENILTKMSKCCLPLPGDSIIGYISIGKGVSIHRKDCKNMQALSQMHSERVIEAHWNEDISENTTGYIVDVEVIAADRSGLVSDLIAALNEAKIPLKSCQAFAEKDRAKVKLGLELKNLAQLDEVTKKLRKVKSVSNAERATTRS